MIVNANALQIPLAAKSVHCVVTSPPYWGLPAILCYNVGMKTNDGRFKKGERRSPSTEFKKGEHWRKHQPYWEKEWLEREYVINQRTAADIAEQFGIRDTAILFWLKKHGIPTRTMTQTRAVKHWGQSGKDNPMHGKTGSKNQNWKGGCTPERQSFYMSQEWAEAAALVWKRDGAKCRRCGVEGGKGKLSLHIHHVIPFWVEASRADPDNLVLLCRECHIFVHSKKNINAEFLNKEVRDDS